MFGERFLLNEQTIPVVEEIGKHMPGGFFIYRAEEPEELLYANQAVFDIFGCRDLAEFKELTGYTFKGMLHPEDCRKVSDSITEQIEESEEKLDYVEYRIIRKDGAVRWVDDYGHFTETEAYGGIYYVFISDITKKKERMASDLAVRQAVIEALSESYHTVWLINDVEKETFSLYRGDLEGTTAHAAPIKDALREMKYSAAKDYYIRTTIVPEDRERMQRELELSYIVEMLKIRPQYTVNYQRLMPDGTERYFRIEFARVRMPGGTVGVVCGFKDVDDDVRQGQAMQKALQEVGLLSEFSSRFPHEFSGGQRQRIGIARSLIMEPEFIVADEPISALDVSIRAQVLNLLNDLKKSRGLTYLFIAHDLSVVRFISDRIAVIHKGRIVELAEAEELFLHPLHPYTQALLSAVPNPNPYLERTKQLMVYNPDIHDYSVDKPVWEEILPDHFIYGNQRELDGYRKELGL